MEFTDAKSETFLRQKICFISGKPTARAYELLKFRSFLQHDCANILRAIRGPSLNLRF